MNIYKVGNNLMALSDKQVENLINHRDNYDIREREIVQELAHGNCLDIGANIGYHTLVMAKSDKVKEVHAFEPDPTNYKNLNKNIVLNHLENKVYTINCAVTHDDLGRSSLYKCDFNDGMHRIYKSKWCNNDDKPIQVNTISIDYYLRDTIYPIGFVKLDIEGSEFGALKGMEQMLKRDHPTIMMEFHPPSIEEAGDKPEDSYNFLMEIGYTRFDLADPYIEDIEYDDILRQTENRPAVNLIIKK